MQTLRHAPLFKLVLAFIAGILLAEEFGCFIALVGLTGLPVYGLLLLLDKRILSIRYEWIISTCIYVSILGTGGATWCLAYSTSSHPVEMINCREVEAVGIITSEVKTSPWGRKAMVSLSGWAQDSLLHPIEGNLQISIPATIDTEVEKFDSVIFRAYITNVRSKYSGYLRYLSLKGIEHIGYVKKIETRGKSTSFQQVAEGLQQWFSQPLSRHIGAPVLASIAKAMFLGDKKSLEKDTRQAFTDAGLSHILAISGLHVGIIYMVLNMLMSPLHLFRHGKRVKHFLILVFLLAYMVITGATPAVIRAVLMFGTILVFRIWYQRYQLLNLIAISAFIQLVWDPGILYQVSFQLSYSAVLGIVLLLPIFEKTFTSPWPFLNKVYSWIGVTCAATLFTLPFVIVYFGQFPTYFLLSNVLVAVLTAGVVMLGFVTVLFGWIPGVGMVLGFCCEISLKALFIITEWVAGLPYAVITRISWDEPGVWYLVLQLGVAGVVLMMPRGVGYVAARMEMQNELVNLKKVE